MRSLCHFGKCLHLQNFSETELLRSHWQNYTISSQCNERDLQARFLHPVFGIMTERFGCEPHYDYSDQFTERAWAKSAMQWATGDAEEKVLNCRLAQNTYTLDIRVL